MKAAYFLSQANEEEAAVIKVGHAVLTRQIFQTAVRGFKVFVGRVELIRAAFHAWGFRSVSDQLRCTHHCPCDIPDDIATSSHEQCSADE